jgi:hypothetical protein
VVCGLLVVRSNEHVVFHISQEEEATMRKAVVLIGLAVALVGGSAWADDLYVTDFESFSLGNVGGQYDWVAITDADGQIVDDGTGNKVLQVTASSGGWGDDLGRGYNSTSTKQYLTIEMDFQVVDEEDGYWFMDNNTTPGVGPETIMWGEDWNNGWIPTDVVFSNARPGLPLTPYTIGTWYHVGIEIDQQAREILRFNVDGTWVDDDDSAGITAPAQLSRFVFRSSSPTAGTRLWIDNLSITDRDAGGGPGDVDGNGVVDGLDLTAVISAWETIPGDLLWDPDADLDGNNVVNGLDLTEVISNWTVSSSSAPEESEPAKPGKRLGNVRKGR